MKNIDFIAARYKENISKEFLENNFKNKLRDKDTEIKVFMYDKFSKKEDTHKLLENIGREHYAWVIHILDTWDNPPDYYAFIHPSGNKEGERPDKLEFILNIVSDYNNMLTENRKFGPIVNKNDIKGNTWDQNFYFKKHWIGNTQANVVDVYKQTYTSTKYNNIGEWWIDTTGIIEFPTQRTSCGMCITSSDNIKSWGIKFWEKILEQIIEGGINGEISHFLERAFYTFAKGKK